MLSKVLIKLSFLKEVFYSAFIGINTSCSSYPLNAIIGPGVSKSSFSFYFFIVVLL
jgi:hypothetical protein